MSPVQSLIRRDANWRLKGIISTTSSAGTGGTGGGGGGGGGSARPTNYGEYEPSYSTAGVLPGVTLTKYTPTESDRCWKIRTEGAVIKNYEIFGRVKPEAKNIVFENCHIRGLPQSMLVNGAHQPLADCVSSLTTGGPTLFRDCTIVADAVWGGVDGVKGGNFVAERCVVAGTIDAFKVYNRDAVIKGCYVPYLVWISDDPEQGPEGSHNDNVQFQGGSNAPFLTMTGNSFNVGYSPYGSSNLGVLVTADAGTPGGYAIEGNYFRTKLSGNRVGIPINLSIGTVTNFTVRNNKIQLGRDNYHIIARSAILTKVRNEPGNVDLDTGGIITVQNGG